MPDFCFVILKSYRIKTGGEQLMKKQKGNFFLLPNSIFDEDMKLRDFAVYSFLVSRKNSVPLHF